MSDGRGGARPGAGRPKLESSILRKVLIEHIEANAQPIAAALLEKGLKGDVQALRELLDRGLGKPQQAVDVTTEGNAISINVVKFEELKSSPDSHA